MSNIMLVCIFALGFYSQPSLAADAQAPNVFTEVVKTEDNGKIKDHMGQHLYRLFDEVNNVIGKLDTQDNLSSEDFQLLYKNLTEMRAHFVAVIPKLPPKIKNDQPDDRATLFRTYQKYLANAILYTIRIEETIDMEAATKEQIRRRNDELVRLVGKFTIMIGRAHSHFRD